MIEENIYKSLDTIAKNISKQNNFYFSMSKPNLNELQKYNIENSDTSLDLYIVDASLPSLNITLSETKYLNEVKYTLLHSDVDSVNVVFYDTKTQTLRNFFVDYVKTITSFNRYSRLKYYPSDYQTRGVVQVEEQKYEYIGATPTNVGDFILSHNNTDSLGTFNVTFKLKDIYPI